MALSQALPVTTIPLSTTVTSITTGTSSNQVTTNTAGLNFINVVGSVCGAQTLMSGSSPLLGCGAGAMSPAGLTLSSLLPSGGLLPSALPAALPPSSQPGGHFGLKNPSSLRPLNLLQLPGSSLIFNPLQQHQQQQLSPFPSHLPPPPQSMTASPQQQAEQASEQGRIDPDQALSAQQAAMINLPGVGNFLPPQSAAAVTILGAPNGYSAGSSGSAPASSFRQPVKK